MSEENVLSGLKILLVDDDRFTLDFNTRVLSSLGCENISTALNGKMALDELAQSKEPFDIVICDLKMPDMDGFDFITAVGKWGNTGGLIVLSGEGRRLIKEARKKAIKTRLHILGAIAKPLEKEALRTMLLEYLQKYT